MWKQMTSEIMRDIIVEYSIGTVKIAHLVPFEKSYSYC